MSEPRGPRTGNLNTDYTRATGEDADGHVFVNINASPNDPVPVTLSTISSGTKKFFDATQVASTPGVQQTLITTVVAVGKTLQLCRLNMSTRQPGCVVIEAGGSTIGLLNTGASGLNAKFQWTPSRPIAAGVTINVKFKQFGSTPISEVSAYLMATET